MATFRKAFLKGATTTSIARAVEAAAVFGKNLLLANLLGASNQGVAVSFALVMSLLDMLSDMGAGRLLVQSDEGDQLSFQASMHTVEILRGLLIGGLIFGFASQIARFFQVPEAAWAFRYLASVPVIRSFQHLDTLRFARSMKFGGNSLVNVGPQVLTVLLAYPIAILTRDYTAALALVIIQAAAMTVLSHLVAERPYRLGHNRQHLWQLFQFGGPLLLNSGLLFATLQGDRAIIGRFYSIQDLGVFATAGALTLMAGKTIMSVVTPLALPALTLVNKDAQKFGARLQHLQSISTVASVSIAVGFVLAGPSMMKLLYRAEYFPAVAFIGILGISAAGRVLRVAPNAAQMARADNMSIVYGNLLRLLGSVLALVAAFSGRSLATIALAGLTGELVALIGTAELLQRRQELPRSLVLKPVAVFCGCSALAWCLSQGLALLSVGEGFRLLAGLFATAAIIAGVVFSQEALREGMNDLRGRLTERFFVRA